MSQKCGRGIGFEFFKISFLFSRRKKIYVIYSFFLNLYQFWGKQIWSGIGFQRINIGSLVRVSEHNLRILCRLVEFVKMNKKFAFMVLRSLHLFEDTPPPSGTHCHCPLTAQQLLLECPINHLFDLLITPSHCCLFLATPLFSSYSFSLFFLLLCNSPLVQLSIVALKCTYAIKI